MRGSASREAGSLDEEPKRVAGIFQSEVTFETIEPVLARTLAELTEAELTELLADSLRPERRAQREALRRANASLQERLQAWIRDDVLPEMVKLLICEGS